MADRSIADPSSIELKTVPTSNDKVPPEKPDEVSSSNNKTKSEDVPKPTKMEGTTPKRAEADGGNDEPEVKETSFIGNLVPSTFLGVEREIPDINFYQHKKTLGKGMMDLALFSANSNQLRYVLECADRHPFFYPSLCLIIFSLVAQVVVGMTLLWNATYNVKYQMHQANRANNYTVIVIFLVTVVNVFLSAFGVANPPLQV